MHAGTTTTQTFTISNNGNVALRGLELSSGDLSSLACSPALGNPAAPLLAGASALCSGSRRFSQGDIEAGDVTHSVTAAALNTFTLSGAAFQQAFALARVAVPNAPALTLGIAPAACISIPRKARESSSRLWPSRLWRPASTMHITTTGSLCIITRCSGLRGVQARPVCQYIN